MVEAFPPGWMRPGAVRQVIRCLKRLPISARRKKHALYEWCMVVGVELTAAMVEEVTGLPAGAV